MTIVRYGNKIKDLVEFPDAVWKSKEGAAVSFRVHKMSVGKGTWLRPLQQGGCGGRYLALIQYPRLQQALLEFTVITNSLQYGIPGTEQGSLV